MHFLGDYSAKHGTLLYSTDANDLDLMEPSMAIASMPASRQKSCNGCVQAKRRCNRRTPVCSRCAEKGIFCVYAKDKPFSRSVEHDAEIFTSVDSPSLESPACPFFASGLTLEDDYLGLMPMNSAPDRIAPTVELADNYPLVDAECNDNIQMDPFMGLMGNGRTPSQDQWLAPMNQAPIPEHASDSAHAESMTTYQKMAGFCEHIEPWHLYDPDTPLFYVVARIKAFSTDVATRNATPFLHRYLYRDHAPQCILSCFAVNVLYVNRTEANTAMVMRVLHSSVRELGDTEARRIVATPIEKLARAQTLFLYQIIRLFDGDVILRAQGEKDMPLLRTWLSDLCRVREHLGNLSEFESGVIRRQPPRIEWEGWIFAESVRRTIVMAYSVISLYGLMKDPECTEDLEPWAQVHRWTLSRRLWEAKSSLIFDRIWKERPYYVIHNHSFEKFLEHGRGEDVDEFAEILLSVYIGVDATKEFVSSSQQ